MMPYFELFQCILLIRKQAFPPLDIRLFPEMTSDEESEALLKDWAASSQLLYYTVICVSIVTLPSLVLMFVVLRRYSKSNYYCFLCSILVGNFVLLATIFTNVISDRNVLIFAGASRHSRNHLRLSLFCKFFLKTTGFQGFFRGWSSVN